MIVHINLIMIFLILFSSTFYFAIKFFFEKKLSRFYIDFFQSLPSGGIILDEHFDIIDCNAFIGSLFNKSSQNNLDTFIDKPTIIKTIQRKKKSHHIHFLPTNSAFFRQDNFPYCILHTSIKY